LVALSRDIQVERNSLARDGAGIAVNRSNHVRIVGNTASGNDVGVEIFDQSDHNAIEENFVSNNAFAGIVADADDTRVNRNRVLKNGDGIIIFGSGNNVTGNQIVDAVGCPEGCGYGISLEGGAGNLIERNVVYRTSADGIRIAAFEPDVPTVGTVVRDNRVVNVGVDGFSVATDGEGTVSGTLLRGNVATGSGDDGFDIRSVGTTVTSNVAVRNGDLGVEALPGVTDGGGNKASGNGSPLQCTGIACSS
jgi:parallel beta-helix repeat protein